MTREKGFILAFVLLYFEAGNWEEGVEFKKPGSTKSYERLKAEMEPHLELFLDLLCSLASYPEGEYIMRL